ncbi:hypothetical protein [Microbulbifer sp. Q7]|uniref:hypothetical protein n=1 Tax=Microbulbifer sp. Q7 TaxID=1785091 RepID=UPI00082C9BDD|nr:hypothetical protein [Microbulbifer sp. Q7]
MALEISFKERVRPQALPLSVWCLCVFFMILPVWTFYLKVWVVNPSDREFAEYNLQRISSVIDQPSLEKLFVVMIGDSRLRYSTVSEEELSSHLANELGRPVSILRIVKDVAVFGNFTVLSEKILQLQPDLVVIQEDLFTKRRSIYGHWFFSRKYIKSKYFSAFLGRQADQAKQQTEVSCDALSTNETVEQRTRHFLKWARYGKDGDIAPGLVEFLKKAALQGVNVRGVSIPISPRGQGLVPRANSTLAVRVGSTSREFVNGQYCDVVHMNQSGRKLYSEWLVTFLASEINRQVRKS